MEKEIEEKEAENYWEEEKFSLSNLFKKYDFDISTINLDLLIENLHLCRSNILNIEPVYNIMNRPEDIILFIHDCQNSKIKLSGTITNPREGQIKGVPLEIEISETYLIELLCHAKELFNISELEKLEISEDIFCLEDELNIITEVQYAIMESFSRLKKEVNKNIKGLGRAGQYLNIIYIELEERGIFKAKKESKISGGKAEGITNEYCFIYDCLVKFKALPEIEDNKEKYDKIKYYFEAYERQSKKLWE